MCAWCGGGEGFRVIIGIGSHSNEQKHSMSHCLMASTLMSLCG